MRALAAAALAILPAAAGAFPNAAPFDHDGGQGRPDCSACHFDADSIRNAGPFQLSGFPASAAAGQRYELTILIAGGASAAGFVMTAAARGNAAGAFEASDARTEVRGTAIRSVDARVGVGWRFSWTAPKKPGVVRFFIAANRADDDGSPFGDEIYVFSRQLKVK